MSGALDQGNLIAADAVAPLTFKGHVLRKASARPCRIELFDNVFMNAPDCTERGNYAQTDEAEQAAI